MSDIKTATSGAIADSSGSVEVVFNDTVGGMYKPDFVNKLKKEKENTLKANAELKAKYEEAIAEISKIKETELQTQSQYKTLWENEKKSKSEILESLKAKEEQIKKGKMVAALRGEYLKLGLDPKFLDDAFTMTDWKQISIEPETESVIGAEDAAKAFYQKFGSTGLFQKQGVMVNHNAASMTKPEVSYDKMTYKEKLNALKQHVPQK